MLNKPREISASLLQILQKLFLSFTLSIIVARQSLAEMLCKKQNSVWQIAAPFLECCWVNR